MFFADWGLRSIAPSRQFLHFCSICCTLCGLFNNNNNKQISENYSFSLSSFWHYMVCKKDGSLFARHCYFTCGISATLGSDRPLSIEIAILNMWCFFFFLSLVLLSLHSFGIFLRIASIVYIRTVVKCWPYDQIWTIMAIRRIIPKYREKSRNIVVIEQFSEFPLENISHHGGIETTHRFH